MLLSAYTHVLLLADTHRLLSAYTHVLLLADTHVLLSADTQVLISADTHVSNTISWHSHVTISWHPRVNISWHPHVTISWHPHVTISWHPRVTISWHPRIHNLISNLMTYTLYSIGVYQLYRRANSITAIYFSLRSGGAKSFLENLKLHFWLQWLYEQIFLYKSKLSYSIFILVLLSFLKVTWGIYRRVEG